MSRSLLFVAILCLVGLAAAIPQDVEFDQQLSSLDPELVEQSAPFQTLDTLGAGEPDAVFAELDAQHSSTETEQPETEEEAAPEDAALMEVDAQTEESDPKPWHRSDANQPVARHNAEITCIDGDCTRATKVRKAAVGTHPNADTKPPPSKLDIALGAVKEEIMVRAKELHKEKDWAQKVAQLIDEYQQKLQKVEGNIVSLRVQTKALLRKKKQIQNVQVQNKLRYKLKLAQADLNRLQKQMEHISSKENEFQDTENQLKNTMNALKNSLLKLRGQEPKKLLAEGIDVPLPAAPY